MNKIILLFSLLIICSVCADAQIAQLKLNFSYGLDVPAGDLKDRFGVNYSPGLALEYAFANDYFIASQVEYMIGSNVKEDAISSIRESSGLIISQQQSFSRLTLKQRMYSVDIHGGKFFSLAKEKNYRHGIRVHIGVSMLTHYLQFNDESAATVQLTGDYAKGYDKLTRGFGINQFIGYQYMNRKGNFNIFGGLQFTQTIGKSLRPVDFNTGNYAGDGRIDILSGIRVGASFILYSGHSKDEIFY